MRLSAAYHDGVGLAGEPDIVRVPARAAQQLGILDARHRLSDAELGKRYIAPVAPVAHS